LQYFALITTPAILNVIEDARLKGSEDKAWGVIAAVKQQYATAGLTTGFNNSNLEVNFASAVASQTIGGQKVQMSGERPTAGKVTINSDGSVKCENLRFNTNGNYICTSNTEGTKMCCKRGTANVTCS